MAFLVGRPVIRRASAIMDNDPQYPFERDLFADMAVIDYGDCLLDYGNHGKTPATIEREAAKILKSGAFLVTTGAALAETVQREITTKGKVTVLAEHFTEAAAAV